MTANENTIIIKQVFTIRCYITDLQYMITPNESKQDYPLQVNLFRSNLNKSDKSKNMPRQIKDDAYRHNKNNKDNKQNGQFIQQIHLLSYPFPVISNQKDQKIDVKVTLQNKNQTDHKQKNSQHLRTIIKRQLFTNHQSQKRLFQKLPLVEAESNYKSKYQILLSQLYGQPNKYSENSKKKLAINNSNKKQRQMSRYGSLKQLKQSKEQKQPKLLRIKSSVSIKSKPATPRNSRLLQIGNQNQLAREPTYLELYMQKRRAVLFL